MLFAKQPIEHRHCYRLQKKNLTSKLSQGFSYDFMVKVPKMKSDIMDGVSQINTNNSVTNNPLYIPPPEKDRKDKESFMTKKFL